MSTYNCFIRKNNKYLRKKLRDLGYLDNTCFASFDNFLYTLYGDYYTCKSYDKFSNMRSGASKIVLMGISGNTLSEWCVS